MEKEVAEGIKNKLVDFVSANQTITKPNVFKTKTEMATWDSAKWETVDSLDDEAFIQAQHAVAAYREMLSESKKVYDEMLKPLNSKRKVILDWRKEDQTEIKARVDTASKLLEAYELQREIEDEERATEVLVVAKAKALELQEASAIAMEAIADELDVVCPDAAEDARKEAQAVRDAPAPIVAVLPDAEGNYPPHGHMLNHRDIKTVEVVDMVLLAEAVANHRLPPEVLKPNLTELNKMVRSPSVNDSWSPAGCTVHVNRSYMRKAGGA
mgnify:CR=1 FL=1